MINKWKQLWTEKKKRCKIYKSEGQQLAEGDKITILPCLSGNLGALDVLMIVNNNYRHLRKVQLSWNYPYVFIQFIVGLVKSVLLENIPYLELCYFLWYSLLPSVFQKHPRGQSK